MTEDVSRRIGESKKKIQRLAKEQTHPNSAAGPKFRSTPTGRKLAELKKRKQGQT